MGWWEPQTTAREKSKDLWELRNIRNKNKTGQKREREGTSSMRESSQGKA